MTLNLSRIASPLGEILLVSDERGHVRALDFADHMARMHRRLLEQYGAYELIERQAPEAVTVGLDRYFQGGLDALDGIVTSTVGTGLQCRVSDALRRIPAGMTTSYGELALEVGFADSRGAIAVGAANAANPVSIIVPCHRVIARNGDLKGYAGGVHRKQWLLEHEGVQPQASSRNVALQLPGL